jgi:hypothetical protein
MSRRRNDASHLRKLPVLYVEDVMHILDIKQSLAYRIMAQIRRELEEEGYIMVSGRIPEARFREKFYYGGTEANEQITRHDTTTISRKGVMTDVNHDNKTRPDIPSRSTSGSGICQSRRCRD